MRSRDKRDSVVYVSDTGNIQGKLEVKNINQISEAAYEFFKKSSFYCASDEDADVLYGFKFKRDDFIPVSYT